MNDLLTLINTFNYTKTNTFKMLPHLILTITPKERNAGIQFYFVSVVQHLFQKKGDKIRLKLHLMTCPRPFIHNVIPLNEDLRYGRHCHVTMMPVPNKVPDFWELGTSFTVLSSIIILPNLLLMRSVSVSARGTHACITAQTVLFISNDDAILKISQNLILWCKNYSYLIPLYLGSEKKKLRV